MSRTGLEKRGMLFDRKSYKLSFSFLFSLLFSSHDPFESRGVTLHSRY